MDSRTPPKDAEISYCIAVIPASPLYEQISEASLAITAKWENQNIIDNKRFPAHISLIISGVSSAALDVLKAEVSKLASSVKSAQFEVVSLYKGSRGFIGVRCTGAILEQLGKRAFDASAVAISNDPCVRPHLSERWSSLSEYQQGDAAKYGSYKTNDGDYHLSVAQVDQWDVGSAIQVAEKIVSVHAKSTISAIQLIDVGHHNEQWKVLQDFPITL
jgi:hypothetical protein